MGRMARDCHVHMFVAMTAEEAIEVDHLRALSVNAFEDKSMSYICLHRDQSAALKTALRVKTKAAVEAAMKPSTWCVFKAVF